MIYLASLKDYNNQDHAKLHELGQKAASLVSMAQADVLVPEGAVLRTGALQDHLQLWGLEHLLTESHFAQLSDTELAAQCQSARQAICQQTLSPTLMRELSAWLDQYPGVSFAVRSSGTMEDLQDSSFAGLYDSVLNVRGVEGAANAVLSCWASLFNERVIQYTMQRNIALSEMDMAVIVQRMVHADISGVLFTCNPVTANSREIIIEACSGVGESLVSGHVTPQSYVCDWHSGDVISQSYGDQTEGLYSQADASGLVSQPVTNNGNTALLSAADIDALVNAAHQLQASYGKPLDIEWAMEAQGEIYFVQARPITAIDFAAVPSQWTTADFKDGGIASGPCARLMYSLYQSVWNKTLPEYLYTIKLAPKGPVKYGIEMLFGRPYWNLSEIKDGLKKLPGFVEREFDESLGIEVGYSGRGHVTPTNLKSMLTGIRALLAIRGQAKHWLKGLADFKAQQLAKLGGYEQRAASLNDADFLVFYREFIQQDYHLSEGSYFWHIFITNNLHSLFVESVTQWANSSTQIALFSGLSDLSHLRVNRDVWLVAQGIREHQDALKYWSQTPVEKLAEQALEGQLPYGQSEVTDLIMTHYYRSTRELDLLVPCYRQAPLPMIETLKNTLISDKATAPQAMEEAQYAEFLKNQDVFLDTVPRLKRASVAKGLKQLRDFLWWREELRDLSTRHYYFVQQFTQRVGDILLKTGHIAELDDVFHVDVGPLLQALSKPNDLHTLPKLVKVGKAEYQGYRHYTSPDELGLTLSSEQVVNMMSEASDSDLKGLPCSGGVVTGTARVIMDIPDASRLQPGDILVTKYTDPGWTSKFSLISAVVTETGGVLSHASVISREYGIPAVLAVKGAMQKINDGDTIVVDGYAGVVKVVE